MNIPQKKEDILNAAERLFYEYGFRGVGLKQIINEADVANMTLYNHFSSKEQLVEEVLKQRETRYWSYLDQFVQGENETPFLMAVEAHGQWLKEESYKGICFYGPFKIIQGTVKIFKVLRVRTNQEWYGISKVWLN